MAGSTVNAVHGMAPGGPGSTAKATVTSATASTATAFRTPAPANQNLSPVLVNITCADQAAPGAGGQAGYHIVFGDANVAAPTDADFLVQQADGIVTWSVPASATHFRIKNDATVSPGSFGSVYVYVSG